MGVFHTVKKSSLLLSLIGSTALVMAADAPALRPGSGSSSETAKSEGFLKMHNVRDFGAVGDGVTNDTKAIQRAIDAGGAVYFPEGIYKTGTLWLRSNGGLELAPNATLLASTDPADYNKPEHCQQEAGSSVGGGSQAHLIIALEQENIFIRGGKFDGNGRTFFKGKGKNDRFSGGTTYEPVEYRPAQLLFICECTNVRLTDFNIDDPTSWSCFLFGCENVTVRGLRIRTSAFIGEDDGIDIDSCRFVTVSDCDIQTGDDALTIRAASAKLKNPKPCEWVTVSNCILKSFFAHAIRVGVGSGIIRHCSVSNTLIHGNHCAVHINSNFSGAKGVNISDVVFNNLHVDVEMLTSICLDYKFITAPCDSVIKDITFSNITGKISIPSRIVGNDKGTVSGIRFRDVNLFAEGDCNPSERTKTFMMLKRTDGLFLLEKTSSVEFDHVDIICENPKAWPVAVVEDGCSGTVIRDCRFSCGK